MNPLLHNMGKEVSIMDEMIMERRMPCDSGTCITGNPMMITVVRGGRRLNPLAQVLKPAMYALKHVFLL